MTFRWISVALLFAAGCSRCGASNSAPDASASAPDTGAPAIAAKADTGPSSGNALDDLLHFTDARLGVSSKVDNPRDHAEHVADGKLDTAWNGKTGDLVGGWIGFRVPKDTRVRIIELTVGYVAKSKKGDDLFLMNHRIAKVRVTRDGKAVKEHTFDPENRGYQRITLDEAGGDFKLEVLEVKAGTKKEWRELVVSEIRVFGTAGSAKLADPIIPRVMVGGLDAPKAKLDLAKKMPASSLSSDVSASELCSKWLDPIRDEWESAMDGGSFNTGSRPWESPEPTCTFSEEIEGGVGLVTFGQSDLDNSWADVGVTYDKKTWKLGRTIGGASHFDPHCGGYSGGRVADAKVEPGKPAKVVFHIYSFKVDNPWPSYLEDGGLESTPGRRSMQMDEVRCTLAAEGPSCTEKKIAEKDGGYADESIAPEIPPPLPWK